MVVATSIYRKQNNYNYNNNNGSKDSNKSSDNDNKGQLKVITSGSITPYVEGEVMLPSPEDKVILQVLLDTGATAYSYISQAAAQRLPHLRRVPTHVSHETANGDTFLTTEYIEIPIRLLLEDFSYASMDMVLKTLIVEKLNTDVVMGLLHLVEYNLYGIAEVVGRRFISRVQEQGMVAETLRSNSCNSIVSSVPMIQEYEWDTGNIECYPYHAEGNVKLAYSGHESFNKLVEEFGDVFRDTVDAEPARVQPMDLELKPGISLPEVRGTAKVRPQCAEHKLDITRQISELLKLGVIIVAVAFLVAQILMIKKPDGSLRLCIDYRPINNLTQDQIFPLPNIQALLQSLGGYSYFSVLDLTSGYHQCPLTERASALTAFVTHEGTYQFKRVPFII